MHETGFDIQERLTRRGSISTTKNATMVDSDVEDNDDDEKEIILINEDQLDNKINTSEWQSACLTVDKQMVEYLTKLTISLMIIGFCMMKLIQDTSCESQQAYLGLLTLVIGVWLPTPRSLKI